MKKRTSFNWSALALLLAATPGFSSIPDSIWRANDTNFIDMWNKRDLNTDFWTHSTNWSVKNPGDSAMIVTDGLAQTAPNWNNLVWKWQADTSQKNFEIRFSWHMTSSPSGNSGFNARGHCGSGTVANFCGGAAQGYKVYGPQIDLGPTYTTDVWNSGASRYATGSSTCKLGTATTWQDLGYKISNDTAYMFYYPNGFAGTRTVCATYKFTAATDVAATSPGIFALQYETLEISEFKNIKIRNLNAVPASTAIKSVGKFPTVSLVGVGRQSVEFSFPAAERYSVRITDVKGVVVKSFEGTGPVSRQNLSIGASGLFVVKISSRHGTSLQKACVY